MRCLRTLLLLLLFCSAALAQGFHPSTTLASENANNTSAARGSGNGNAPPANISKMPIRSLLYPNATTLIVVRFMPWFGDKGHKEYGYRSDDEQQVSRQVEDMLSRGIDGAVVDWYGPDAGFKNHVTELLLKESERRGFKVAVSEDAGALKECQKAGCDLTGKLIADLRYAAEHFEKSQAYVRIDGRPLVTFFGLEKFPIDWGRVRQQVPGNPVLLFRNSGAFELPFSDGAFSWIAPETVKPGNPYGFDYLEHFHEVARRHSEKFVMGSAYKGFDDSEAGWGKGRKIDQNCGRTWLGTFDILNRFYNERHPLPAVILVTWNDWEEGTEIESGIENCVNVNASADGRRIRWRIEGPKETLDHFEIFAAQDGRNLMLVGRVGPKEDEFDLRSTKLPGGDYTFYVKAVAKPSLTNHMSNAVAANIPGEK
jgi:hypothetical protein